MRNRGVSEVLGFVLVFSLVTASVGVVYVVGFSGLEDARDAQQIENAERALDVLADNVEDSHRDGAPSRATEFKLYDARLGVGEPDRLEVEITNVGSPNPSYSVKAYPIVYEPQNSPTRLVYVNGGTFREDRGGAVLQNRPPLTLKEDATGDRTVLVPFIETRPVTEGSTGGTTTVLIRTERVLSEVLTDRTTPSNANTDPDGDSNDEYNVRYTIETTETRAPLWQEYLNQRFDEEFGTTPCSVSGDTVECVFPTERLYVTATRIDVEIES